jgi:exosortase
MRMKLNLNNNFFHKYFNVEVCSIENKQSPDRGLIYAVLFLTIIFIWSYWATIIQFIYVLFNSDDYSVCLLIPFAAVFLVWHDRKEIKSCSIIPCWRIGIIMIIISQIVYVYGLLDTIQRYSIILTIISLVIMVGGWQLFRKLVWILMFLFLMVPIPPDVRNLITLPLQNIAITSTIFCLEAFGVEAIQNGNIIMLDESVKMGIAEACNGLRMLTAFVIVTAFITYLAKCSRPRKAFLMLSSIPIALICNIIRLCLTAAIMLLVSVEWGHKFFHDFAGLAMMPVAVLLLFAEMWMMDKIFGKNLLPVTGDSQSIDHSKTAGVIVSKRHKKRKKK